MDDDMAPTEHPIELDLFDLATGTDFPGADDVREHVQGCVECGELVEIYASEAQIGDTAAREVPQWSLPAAVVDALQGPTPAPAAFQVWRASWESIAQLVVILRSEGSDAVVAAPIIDREAADPDDEPVPDELAPWGAVVAHTLARTLPTRVLELYLGQQLRPETEGAATVERDPIERAFVRSAVELTMLELSRADWVPAHRTDLVSLLRTRWAKPSDLAAALNIDGTAARQLINGMRTPTDAEQVELQRLGFPADSLVVAPPPELKSAIDDPTVRALWKRHAARHGQDDSAAYRWKMYSNNQFALAARATGRSTNDRQTWLARVREVLDAGT
jgi:hypothetical protein